MQVEILFHQPSVLVLVLDPVEYVGGKQLQLKSGIDHLLDGFLLQFFGHQFAFGDQE